MLQEAMTFNPIQYKRVALAQRFFFPVPHPAPHSLLRHILLHACCILARFILLAIQPFFAMDQRLLPDPTQFGFHGRPGGTLESALSGAHNLHMYVHAYPKHWLA